MVLLLVAVIGQSRYRLEGDAMHYPNIRLVQLTTNSDTPLSPGKSMLALT